MWSPLFTGGSRRAFDALAVDEATVLRSQGAALNQACAALPYYLDSYPLIVERSWPKLAVLGIGAAPPGDPATLRELPPVGNVDALQPEHPPRPVEDDDTDSGPEVLGRRHARSI